MATDLPSTTVDTTTPYRLVVTRQDNGNATMQFYYNGVAQTAIQTTTAGWDDAIPWEAGTYFAQGGFTRFKPNLPMWDFITDPVGREAVQLHARQSARPDPDRPGQNAPVSWGSEGCLVADGTFLRAMDAFIKANGKDVLQIDVVNDFPVSLTLSTTETTVSEGSRFALNVNLNQAISKDIWVHVGLAAGSQATSPEAAAQQGDASLRDYRFVENPIPNSTTDNLRNLGGIKNDAFAANRFDDGWYVMIPRGQTTAQIVIDVLADNRAEGSELARFQINDYAINTPRSNDTERLYSDYKTDPKILITNGGSSTANVTITDNSDLPVISSGANFTFRKVVQVTAGQQIHYDFEAYTIPDGLQIFDSRNSYVDTGGLISGNRSGTFTVGANTNGLMTITVTGNVDPSTAWDIVVEQASAASQAFPSSMSLSLRNNGGESAVPSSATEGSTQTATNPAAAVVANAAINAGMQETANFAQGGAATFTATLIAGHTYSVTVVSSTPSTVDPKLVFVDGFGTLRNYANTESNSNAAAYFTATANENVTFTVSDALGRAGSATFSLNDIAPTDRNAFVVNAAVPLVVESFADDGGLQIEVSRLGNVSAAASVSWRVVSTGSRPLTAADFGGVLPSGTLTFAAGDQSAFIDLFPTADGFTEGVESAIVELFNPVGGVIATLRIHGQEGRQTIFVADAYDAPVNEPGTPLDDDIYGSPLGDTLKGQAGKDTFHPGAGGDILTGGADADKFIFDAAALTDGRATTPIFDRITDFNRGNSSTYSAAEGDQIDLSAILSVGYNRGSGQTAGNLVRVVADPSNAFTSLQVDPDGTANGASWTTIARLDGVRAGDSLKIILDSALPAVTISVPGTNRAPVVTAPQANVAAAPGQSIALSSLFRASDADGDALTYFVYDGNAGAGSGRVMLNGTAIPAGAGYQMTAAQFAQATFVTGTSGSDNLAVQVFDGKVYSGWNTVVTISVNRTPVVTAPQANVAATAGQTIALSSLFSASDPDGNPLTYFVYDGNAGASSGRIMLNGTAIPAGVGYQMTAAQFAQATFVAGAAGNTDGLAVQAYDGKAFSGYTAINVAVPAAINHPPVATASQANVTATAGQTFTLSSRFAASDPDGDALTYFVYDSNAGAGSGRIMLNGTAIPAGAGYQMTAAQFAQATFVAGSAGSIDDIRVQVYDGKAYSGWNTGVVFTVPAGPPDDYRDSLSDTTAAFGQITVNGTKTGNLEVTGDRDWFAVQLVANVNYTFNLQGTTGGGGTLADPYLRLYNGNGSSVLASDDDIDVVSNRDSQFTYRPTASGTYYLEAGAFSDGYIGTYRIGFTQPFNHPPVVGLLAGTNVRAAASQPLALANLFAGLDPDNDPLTYFVYDGNAAANSGRFMLNGTAIPAGAGYQMTAAQFAQATFVAGASGVSDSISVQVFDGQAYSGWNAVVNVSANNTPVVTAPQANVTAIAGQTFALSSLFSASDRDNDTLTYFVYDGNAGAGSGRVMLNGTAIAAGASYQMTAAQFAQATFVAGAGNTADNIAVQVFDGRAYSGYTAIQLSVPNRVPIVTAPQANIAATGHQSIPLTSLFTVSDSDGDGLTYFVYDGSPSATSGRIMLNGTALAAGTAHAMTAFQFAQATFVTGDGGSADSIAVQAFDGRAYSGYTAVQLSVANHAPTVSRPQGANVTATSSGQPIWVDTLFSGSDSDGDALTYYLYDSNSAANSGHFVVGGNAVAAQSITPLTAAQFAVARFVTGAGGTYDDLLVQTFDGKLYSGWGAGVHVSVPAGANHAPTVVKPSGDLVSVAAGQPVDFTALFSGSDLDGNALIYYRYDNDPSPGGMPYIPPPMTAAEYAQQTYIPVGPVGTIQDISIAVSDGNVLQGASLQVKITTGNHKPMVGLPAGASVDANPGQTLALSSLFRGSDADGNALTYFVYDSNAAANSGHFVVGGNVVAAQTVTPMTAAQLATATFVAGAAGTADDILVQAFDGQLYSGWNAGLHVFV